MADELDHLDCAVEMLRGLKAGKSPAKVRSELKEKGYTQQQIADAGEALVKAT